MDFAITAHSERFDEQDRVWLKHEAELFAALRERGIPLWSGNAFGSGDKGLPETIVMALTSAATLKSAVECWKLWLERDRTRRMEITRTHDGVDESLTISGRDIEEGRFDRIVDEFAERFEKDL
ncbi:hypothetical protein GCM10023195_53710 [Actinoallomurus liliacearum]|uniref:Uncharacterized protein n=1 Tax=Actinoallomurus liliacearum TaxID=1080073 RepID=A0ABP8TRT6_9ACTN